MGTNEAIKYESSSGKELGGLFEEEGSAMLVPSASSMTAMDGAVREIGAGQQARAAPTARDYRMILQELFPEESS